MACNINHGFRLRWLFEPILFILPFHPWLFLVLLFVRSFFFLILYGLELLVYNSGSVAWKFWFHSTFNWTSTFRRDIVFSAIILLVKSLLSSNTIDYTAQANKIVENKVWAYKVLAFIVCATRFGASQRKIATIEESKKRKFTNSTQPKLQTFFISEFCTHIYKMQFPVFIFTQTNSYHLSLMTMT